VLRAPLLKTTFEATMRSTTLPKIRMRSPCFVIHISAVIPYNRQSCETNVNRFHNNSIPATVKNIMPIIQIGDQYIHAVKSGSSNRQVAILIHGWSSSWYAMLPTIELLRQQFHCIAIDLPGFGDSPPLKRRVTIREYTDLVARLIRQQTKQPVVLVGHSMGGMIGITLARYYPDLVDRLVLLCPTITGKLSRLINFAAYPVSVLEQNNLGRILVAGVENLFAGITDRIMRPASFAENTNLGQQEYMRLRADARRRGQGRVRTACFRAMRENNMRHELKHLNTPTLVICGAEDNTVPLRDASLIAEEWPDADLRILPNAGHWPQFERPTRTFQLISSFLGFVKYDLFNIPADNSLVDLNEIIDFLPYTSLGDKLQSAHYTRLAAQLDIRRFPARTLIAKGGEMGRELFLVMRGTIEIWKLASNPNLIIKPAHHEAQAKKTQLLSVFRPGTLTGELSVIDRQRRSADMRAGEEGAVVLVLTRQKLLHICESDPELGARVVWNIASFLSKRLRNILYRIDFGELNTIEDFDFQKEFRES